MTPRHISKITFSIDPSMPRRLVLKPGPKARSVRRMLSLLPTSLAAPLCLVRLQLPLHIAVMSLLPEGSTLLLAVAGLAALVFLASRTITSGHDSREPPLAPSSIPVIGHILGLSKSKFNYYVELRYVFGP
jgi:hypothetical protein